MKLFPEHFHPLTQARNETQKKHLKLAPTYSSPCGVPSVVEDFTAVFGMRTGVPPPPKHQL